MGAPAGWNEGRIVTAPPGWDEAVAPPSPEPAPSVSLGETTVGEDWQGDPAKVLRHGVPIAAGLVGGMLPGAGFITGPLAAASTDMLMGKIYGEGEGAKQRETSFLTDVGIGLAPPAVRGAYGVAKKMIPAPLESKIASTIRYGIEKGIRPSVAGKSNFPQSEQYFKKAQSAVETIIENKPILKFTDETGEAVVGQLPKNLNQFSQSVDQTKRHIFGQYDDMLKHSQLTGRDVDLSSTVSELKSFMGTRANRMAGGTGLSRASELIGEMEGQTITLTEAQDILAVLNGRTKAFLRNPTPDHLSSYAVDTMTANKLRQALDSAVEASGYMPLRKQYGALREIEKEVQNRAIVDARKNTKGLLDFADIASAAEAARAVASMSAGPAAAAITIKGMKEYFKYLNNPNRIIGKMFSEADRLIATRGGAVPLKALPPGPRSMGGKMPESYVRGYPSDLDTGGYLGPRALMSGPGRLSLPPKGGASVPTPLPGTRGLLFREFGEQSSNPAYDMTDIELIRALSKKGKTK